MARISCFHGTHDGVLRSILRDGFADAPEFRVYDENGDPFLASLRGVYVTREPAAAIRAAERALSESDGLGDRPVLIRVTVDTDQAVIDEDELWLSRMPFEDMSAKPVMIAAEIRHRLAKNFGHDTAFWRAALGRLPEQVAVAGSALCRWNPRGDQDEDDLELAALADRWKTVLDDLVGKVTAVIGPGNLPFLASGYRSPAAAIAIQGHLLYHLGHADDPTVDGGIRHWIEVERHGDAGLDNDQLRKAILTLPMAIPEGWRTTTVPIVSMAAGADPAAFADMAPVP